MGVPLTGTRDFESFRVDNQMGRALMRSGGRRHVDVFVPPRQRGVVRCFQVELHQPQQRVEESLALSERKVKDHAQRQRRHDCQIRVARLATATAVPRWRPGFARLLAEPDRDVATALEITLILRPVGHAISSCICGSLGWTCARPWVHLLDIRCIEKLSRSGCRSQESYSCTKARLLWQFSNATSFEFRQLASRSQKYLIGGYDDGLRRGRAGTGCGKPRAWRERRCLSAAGERLRPTGWLALLRRPLPRPSRV